MKADDEPRSWGLRDDMTVHIRSIKRALDAIASVDEGANFLVMCDLNNVGMNLTFSNRDFTGEEELTRYTERFRGRRLRLLPKTANATFWNGSGSSRPSAGLDYVYASERLSFRHFAGGAEVLVRGWPEFGSVPEQEAFIANFSDHALLDGEVHS
jgi:hypothetical protein